MSGRLRESERLETPPHASRVLVFPGAASPSPRNPRIKSGEGEGSWTAQSGASGLIIVRHMWATGVLS